MNRSWALVTEVPWALVTVTSTTPVPAGAVAVMEVAELTLKAVAGVEPKWTAEAEVSCWPVMVTTVPPEGGPVDGLTPVTMGPLV